MQKPRFPMKKGGTYGKKHAAVSVFHCVKKSTLDRASLFPSTQSSERASVDKNEKNKKKSLTTSISD